MPTNQEVKTALEEFFSTEDDLASIQKRLADLREQQEVAERSRERAIRVLTETLGPNISRRVYCCKFYDSDGPRVTRSIPQYRYVEVEWKSEVGAIIRELPHVLGVDFSVRESDDA